MDIDEHQKTFTNLVNQKEHEIKKLEAEMKDAEGDSRAIESITKASKLLKVEIEDEQQDYLDEREDLIYEMKRNNTKLKELVGLIDETVDECIFSIRRECTNFDNIWIPTEEFQLEAFSNFIKYVGFNTVVVQDIDGMIYYWCTRQSWGVKFLTPLDVKNTFALLLTTRRSSLFAGKLGTLLKLSIQLTRDMLSVSITISSSRCADMMASESFMIQRRCSLRRRVKR